MQIGQKAKNGESALLLMFFLICLAGVSSFFWRLVTGNLFAGQVDPSFESFLIVPILMLGVILLPIAFYSLQQYNDSSAIFKKWLFKAGAEYKQPSTDRTERQERIRKEWKERREQVRGQHSIICPACKKTTFNDLIPTMTFIRCEHCENLIEIEGSEFWQQ